jgi:spermidine synthase
MLKVLGGMFLLSGFAGLLAEQTFEKLIVALVGASTPAAAIVLSVYFLGLTLGAWFYARRRRPTWAPLRVYALLEAGVAVWSLFLLAGHGWMIKAFAPLLGLGADHFLVLQGLRFLVAALWILPPTLMMGATFPVIVDALDRMRIPQPRKAMSRFYSMNLLGAIVGAVLGPYWGFPLLGLGGILVAIACLDGTVALVAVLLGQSRNGRRIAAHDPHPDSPTAPLVLDLPQRILLGVAFLSGFIFFGLEVVWTHLIGVAIGNSVYSFAAMLALVLAGLAIGGGLSTVLFSDRKPIGNASLVAMLLAGAALLALQHQQWPAASMQFQKWGPNLTTFSDGEFLRWMVTGSLLLPSSILLGMVYPALFRMAAFPLANRARLAGYMGAVNSIGCVLGALAAGFLLIPWLRSAATLTLFGLLLVAMALALTLGFVAQNRRLPLLAGIAVVALLWGYRPAWNLLALTSGYHVYFKGSHVGPQSKLVFFHEDTLGGITTVVDNPAWPDQPSRGYYRTLLTNGKFQANDVGEVEAQRGFAAIPALHVNSTRDALVIGLGSGNSAATVRALGYANLDIAEISPGIVEAARRHFSHVNGRILEQPGVRVFLEDGRNVLLLHPKPYDLITMEISSVWFAGSTSLYCREFYELARKRLKPGGVLQQWIQIHHIGYAELGSVISTLRETFPYVSFWVYGGQGILVASLEPQQVRPAAVAAFRTANLWMDPGPEKVDTRLAGLLACRLLAPEEVDRMVQGRPFPINTDLNRNLEYLTPRYNLSPVDHQALNVRALSRFARFPAPAVDPGCDAPLQERLGKLRPEVFRQQLQLDPAPAAKPSSD